VLDNGLKPFCCGLGTNGALVKVGGSKLVIFI
jgi:hypothetical protein